MGIFFFLSRNISMTDVQNYCIQSIIFLFLIIIIINAPCFVSFFFLLFFFSLNPPVNPLNLSLSFFILYFQILLKGSNIPLFLQFQFISFFFFFFLLFLFVFFAPLSSDKTDHFHRRGKTFHFKFIYSSIFHHG